jgi:hypothetical protein
MRVDEVVAIGLSNSAGGQEIISAGTHVDQIGPAAERLAAVIAWSDYPFDQADLECLVRFQIPV